MEPVQPLNPHGTPFLRILALLAFASVVVILSSLGTYWYISNQVSQQNMQQTYQPSPTVESTVSASPTTTLDETANWKTYNNKDLGISFKYPAQLGEVNVSVRSGAEGGKELYGTFSANNGITFKAITSNFAEGRDFSFSETYGFTKIGNDYYIHNFIYRGGTGNLPNKVGGDGKKLVQYLDGSIKGIVVAGSYTQPGQYTLENNQLGAIFNLQGDYVGLGFVQNDKSKLPDKTFINILLTFRAY